MSVRLAIQGVDSKRDSAPAAPGSATDYRWDHRAACRGTNPALFFSISPKQIATAKAICARCPVEAKCLEEAYRSGDECTVRGGLTADERTVVVLSTIVDLDIPVAGCLLCGAVLAEHCTTGLCRRHYLTCHKWSTRTHGHGPSAELIEDWVSLQRCRVTRRVATMSGLR